MGYLNIRKKVKKYHMEDGGMSVDTNNPNNFNMNTSLSEVLFGALLAVGAVSCIWVSTSLLIHLLQNMY